MSNKYQRSEYVSTEVLIARLQELVRAIQRAALFAKDQRCFVPAIRDRAPIQIADDYQARPLTEEDIRRIVREEIKKSGITNTEGGEP